MKYIKLLFGTSVTIYIIAFVAVKLFHFPARLLAKENGVVETLSALLFAAAFAKALHFLMFKQILYKQHRRWLIGLASLSLLGFLEEISFGANYITVPKWYIGEVKIDGFHDIGILTYATWQRMHIPAIVAFIILGFGLLISLIILVKMRRRVYRLLARPQESLLFLFLGVFVGMIGIAMLIDLGIVQHPILRILEELLELNSSFPLILANLYIASLNKSDIELPAHQFG